MYAESEHQIDLFVDPNTEWGKQIVAFSQSQGPALNLIDITNVKVSATQLFSILERLHVNLGDLIDRQNPIVKEHVDEDSDLDNDGWVKVFHQEPRVLTSAIAVKGDKIAVIKQPADILKL